MPYGIDVGTTPNIVLRVYVAEAECGGKHGGLCLAKSSPLTVQWREKSRRAESGRAKV